jgi:inorganic pyrophosphatase/exopolyphosphatase
MLRLVDSNEFDRKQVILVDHNQQSQSVDGIEEASILEVIDHHNLGTIGTSMPINFRCMPVGCTCTIIYKLYQEAGVKIPKDIAGIMLSAILSDTLLFKSPTTTSVDVEIGGELAKIAGLDIEEYGTKMFKAASSVAGLSVDEIIHNDMKFSKLPYGELKKVANDIGLEYKLHFKTVNSVKELSQLLDKMLDPKFRKTTDRIDDDCIEGFVFEDADGFMFKLKVAYYNEWKMLRSVANKIFRSGNINFTGALQSVESNYFYGWCRDKFAELDKQGRWAYSKRDIIDLRDEFRADMKAKGIEYDR